MVHIQVPLSEESKNPTGLPRGFCFLAHEPSAWKIGRKNPPRAIAGIYSEHRFVPCHLCRQREAPASGEQVNVGLHGYSITQKTPDRTDAIGVFCWRSDLL